MGTLSGPFRYDAATGYLLDAKGRTLARVMKPRPWEVGDGDRAAIGELLAASWSADATIARLRALVREARDAIVQRRLGPSLRGDGWMDREAEFMRKSEEG